MEVGGFAASFFSLFSQHLAKIYSHTVKNEFISAAREEKRRRELATEGA
jgi:hypothetical protein